MPLTQNRWPAFAALVLGVSALAIFWYAVLDDPRGEAVPASGGHYVEGVTRSSERINPLFASSNPTDVALSSLVFSGLVRLGPDGTPQPDLAERWEITGNGQSYVFHLRRGVAWQDGEPFSADDVVFTYRTIAASGFKGDPSLAQLMQGVLVTTRDPETVEFKLEQAYAPFLAYLTVGILPEHLLRTLDQNQLFNASFNTRPVGTGPYAFASGDDHRVALHSNSTYYLGPPLVTTLELRFFPDEQSLAAAFRARSIDGAFLDPGLTGSEVMAGDAGYARHELTSNAYFMIYVDTRSPLFDNRDVRRALQQAINRQSLIDDVAGGRGAITDTGIAATSWAYTPVDAPAFDPGAAASLLERAGWSRDSDGIRRNGDLRLSFTLSATNDAQQVQIAQNIARQWRAIGVDAQVQALSAESFVEEHLLTRSFQSALVLVDPGPDPDPYPFWHSSQVPPPGRNLANYSEPRLDDRIERARQTTDTARRKELYAQFENYLVAAAPAIPLYSPVYTYLQAKHLQGFREEMLFTPASRFANVNQWYLNTRVR